MKKDTLSHTSLVVERELLPQYKAYTLLQATLRSLEDRKMHAATQRSAETSISLTQVLRNTEKDPFITDISERITLAENQLASLSDAMKFDTPLIWMMYKHIAYRGTPTAIETLSDLIQHCAKPGYICTKRFSFVNEYLVLHGKKPLTDVATYSLDMRLSELYKQKDMIALVDDPVFMEGWRLHEYHHEGERIAKWENYV